MATPSPNGLKRFYLVLGGVAVLGAGVLLWLLQPRTVSIPANVTVQVADTAGFRGYVQGSPTAPVEVTEYADYQCPACANFETVQWPTIKERLVDAGMVRWRYRDLPLDIHPHARLAAHAAACADDQGKWEILKRGIYDTQNEWSPLPQASGYFRDLAKSYGLDVGAYDACMQSAKFAGRIQASYDEAVKLGVPSTPSFLIGGRIYPGSIPYDQLKAVVDSIAATVQMPAQPPAGR